MNESSREELRAWYRQALAGRASRLETLVPGVVEERPGASGEVRSVARALAGSGATYGFAEVSEAGRAVADAEGGFLARTVGLVDVLRQVASEGATRRGRAGRWLLFAAAPLPDPPEGQAVPPDTELGRAWRRIASRLGVDQPALADRVAERLHVVVADLGSQEREAGLVVPPALALEYGLLPLRDDGRRLVAASANPTDVLAMAALERATGRTALLEVLPPSLLEPALRDRYGGGGTDGPPDHGAPPPPLHLGSTPRTAAPSLTVLVVDDEPGERLLSRTALEGAGFEVLEAGDAETALELLGGDRTVDLALLDVLMPEMDGEELLRAVRRHPRRRHLPVLVVTGLGGEGTEARLLEAGADDYLRKPLDPRVLLARIRACLRRRGVASPP